MWTWGISLLVLAFSSETRGRDGASASVQAQVGQRHGLERLAPAVRTGCPSARIDMAVLCLSTNIYLPTVGTLYHLAFSPWLAHGVLFARWGQKPSSDTSFLTPPAGALRRFVRGSGSVLDDRCELRAQCAIALDASIGSNPIGLAEALDHERVVIFESGG